MSNLIPGNQKHLTLDNRVFIGALLYTKHYMFIKHSAPKSFGDFSYRKLTIKPGVLPHKK